MRIGKIICPCGFSEEDAYREIDKYPHVYDEYWDVVSWHEMTCEVFIREQQVQMEEETEPLEE